MAESIKIGVISILIKNRQTHAANVQDILTAHGHIVMARLGVNVQPFCLKNCTGLVSLAVKGSLKEINQLKSDLDRLYVIVAKKIIF